MDGKEAVIQSYIGMLGAGKSHDSAKAAIGTQFPWFPVGALDHLEEAKGDLSEAERLDANAVMREEFSRLRKSRRLRF